MTQVARSQARWWILTLTAFRDGIPIPDPRVLEPCSCIELFSDAAGLSSEKPLNGWGGCATIGNMSVLTLAPWDSRMITPNEEYNRKLTFLEALASFNTLFSVADLVAGKRVKLVTDNKGFYHAFRKGHSSCDATYSVVLGIRRFAASIDATVLVDWRPRCSDPGSVAADMLSKGMSLLMHYIVTRSTLCRSLHTRLRGAQCTAAQVWQIQSHPGLLCHQPRGHTSPGPGSQHGGSGLHDHIANECGASLGGQRGLQRVHQCVKISYRLCSHFILMLVALK